MKKISLGNSVEPKFEDELTRADNFIRSRVDMSIYQQVISSMFKCSASYISLSISVENSIENSIENSGNNR